MLKNYKIIFQRLIFFKITYIKIRKLLFIFVLPIIFVSSGCSESITAGTMKEAHKFYSTKKYKKAMSIYRYLAAEKNNSKAMFNIGIFYRYGYGVKENNQKAYDSFLNAANAGLSDAYQILGDMNVNGVFEKDAAGKDMIWLKCHKAIVTCKGFVIASIWWYTKAVASGDKKSIGSILSAIPSGGDSADIYAWAQLAEDHSLDVTFYKEKLDSFNKNASNNKKQKAKLWAKELISRYGVNSIVYKNKKIQ